MSLFKQNEYFYRVSFFLIELNFLKGDTNIYFEYITLFEKKKIFTEKNKIFVKIIHIFYLKIYIFSNSFAKFEQPYTMNMHLFPAMFLLLRFLFRCTIISFKQISHLDLLLSVISFVLSLEEATRGVL